MKLGDLKGKITLSFITGALIFIALIGSVIILAKEANATKEVFFVDNTYIRNLYQSNVQKDILSSKIKSENEVTSAIVNFDKDLETALLKLTQDYKIDIYASRAFYTHKDRVDLTPKVIEILESQGYKINEVANK